jgi:HSP20 family molecular chaperone IbpA
MEVVNMFELAPRKSFVPGRKYFEKDDIFSNFFKDFESIFGYDYSKDENGNVVQEIEIPGFNKENVNVEIADGLLTIKGERTRRDGSKMELYKRFTVGHSETVEAEIKDGILTLIYKIPEAKKTKIEVK